MFRIQKSVNIWCFVSLPNAYILSAINDKISEGLQGQIRVVLIYAPWSRDRRGVGWTYTGPHLWWHAQQTKSGTNRPTANSFRAVKLGNAHAASVKKDTLVQKQNWNTSTNRWLIDFRWPEVWKRIEWKCYKNKGSTKKDVPVRKQAIRSRKSQCLPKGNAPITASYLINVFSVTVSRRVGKEWDLVLRNYKLRCEYMNVGYFESNKRRVC